MKAKIITKIITNGIFHEYRCNIYDNYKTRRIKVRFLCPILSGKIFTLQKILKVRYANCAATMENRLLTSYKVKHTLVT